MAGEGENENGQSLQGYEMQVKQLKTSPNGTVVVDRLKIIIMDVKVSHDEQNIRYSCQCKIGGIL